ncbi:MAG: methylmalonyl Co-A mutase-associated GTPase MeaB [Euryarchaeota archaeon]|nr:methylmalonyl Co-A mutase-associated GTPase MeaB [Euryarchaeota archaeon]
MALELTKILDLMNSAKSGDRRSLSQLLTAIQSGEKIPVATSDSWTLGVTGPPGVGKSTLIGRLVEHWKSLGEKVAILAIDPSSPISGGSLLADRIRMGGHTSGEDVFLRSIPLGKDVVGISPFIGDMCSALSECGWSRIIIETVGAGQSEISIIAFADRILLVDGPDRGDIIQAEKAGLMEISDIIAVNKSDLPGAESTAREIELSLSLAEDDGRKVHLVSAMEGHGIEQLLQEIESCNQNLASNLPRIRQRLVSSWNSLLTTHPEIDSLLEKVCDGSITLSNAIKHMGKTIEFGDD